MMGKIVTGFFFSGIAMNIAASLLIDAFYHEGRGFYSWSDYGDTAWTLRIVGILFVIVAMGSAGKVDR